MLKLIKYEFIQSWRNYVYVYLAYFTLSILAGFLMANENMLDTTINAIILTSFLFLGVGIVIGVMISTAQNFITSMFKRQGYLTLTLPVSTHTLILSKILSGFMWILISLIVYSLGIVVFLAFTGVFEYITLTEIVDSIVYILEAINLNTVLLFLTGLVSFISFPILIFACSSIAHSSYIRNHRNFFTVVLFFVYGIISGNFDVFIAEEILASYADVNQYQTVTLLVAVVEMVLLYLATWFFIEKKIEVQ